MKAVRYHEHGGIDVLQVDEIDKPEPDKNEIIVEVKAAGVNPVDTYFREGNYKPVSIPMIPGTDFSGVVDEIGENVEDFNEGDRVFGTGIGKNHMGGYAEFATVPTDRVTHLPDDVSFEVGGVIGVAAVTSWRSLVDYAKLQAGETCLIHGGSGGVGHTAVQIASASGATVITTASPKYHEKLYELGANTVLDYSSPDLSEEVKNAAGGSVDVILDHILDDYLQFDADVASTYGRIVGIGNNDVEAGLTNVPFARSKDLRVHLTSMFNTPNIHSVLEKLARLMENKRLTAEIEELYSLNEAGEAQRVVIEESFLGKLGIKP